MPEMETRPRLRTGLYCVPTDGGAYLLGHHGRTVLRGSAIHSWLERLMPFLTGERTMAQLCDGLSEERREMVAAVIELLYDHDLASDSGSAVLDTSKTPPEHDADVEFLSHFVPAAERRFSGYRGTDVVGIGSGEIFAAWASAVRTSGLHRLRLLDLGDAAVEDIPMVRPALDDAGLGEIVRSAGLVVQVANGSEVERLSTVDRLCRESGTPLVTVARLGGAVWLVPNRPSLCWEDVERRLGKLDAGSGPLPRSTAALVGNQVALLCLRRLTGADEDTERPWVRRIAVDSLEGSRHFPLPHPATRPASPDAESAFLARVEQLIAGPAISDEDLYHRSAPCYDAQFGVFAEVTEREFGQLPLRVSQVTVAVPEREDRHEVFAAGVDVPAARRLANRRALEWYSSGLVDSRRLTGTSEHRAWAYDLVERRARQVAAADAFPCLAETAAVRADSAVASGTDWDSAVAAGLREICRQEAISAIGTQDHQVPVVDLRCVAQDEIASRLLALLRVIEMPVCVYDVTSGLGMPSFAFCSGEETVAYTTAEDPVDALRAGLTSLVLAHQSRIYGQPEYAPAPVPPLPANLRGSATVVPRAVSPDLPLAALAAAGHRPAAVPLDHDPAVHAISPYLVRVVIA